MSGSAALRSRVVSDWSFPFDPDPPHGPHLSIPAMTLLTDREIVAVLSEHRVATTQQISTVLELPERTARYRLDRLWRLGMCGGRQPYADQGSAPYHWWPSRLADMFHRGKELPRGGEREEPQELFLRHAAAITGLYVALVRLAPSLGWELLAFSREVEAREEFTLRDRRARLCPMRSS